MSLNTWGNDFLVNTAIAGDQAQPAVTALPNGQFVAVWADGPNVVARVFHANGEPLTGEFAMGPGEQPDVLALPDGRFAVVWSDGAVRARIYNTDGTPDGA